MANETVPAAQPAPVTAPAQAFAPLQTISTDKIMGALFERALPSLTDEELTRLADSDDLALCIVEQIGTMCEGLACLVEADGGSSSNCGSFQSVRDLPALLFAIGNLAGHAEARMGLARSASNRLATRRHLARAAA